MKTWMPATSADTTSQRSVASAPAARACRDAPLERIDRACAVVVGRRAGAVAHRQRLGAGELRYRVDVIVAARFHQHAALGPDVAVDHPPQHVLPPLHAHTPP